MMRLLPDDVLASVLARLAPRCLAASRCVCRAWRAVVDARRLLRTDLLPLSLGGVYLGASYYGLFPPLFSRLSTTLHDDLDYLLSAGDWTIQDHCNGLLLFPEHVVNPATRQCARLPLLVPADQASASDHHNLYLVFDPFVSPHCEVFSIPEIIPHEQEGIEWPPSSYVMYVFSSRTWRWEERSFIRDGPTRRADAVTYDGHANRYGVYWREALYVQCQDNFVIRINFSTGKYHLIEPPQLAHGGYGTLHLGKSDKGVYYASIQCGCRLQVWLLDESCDQIEWVLKWDNNLKPRMACPNYDDHTNGTWLLQCYGQYNNYYMNCIIDSPSYGEESGWPSDHGDFVSNEYMADHIEDYEEQGCAMNSFTWSSGYDNVPSPEYTDIHDAYGNNIEVPQDMFEWCSDYHDNACFNEARDEFYSGSLSLLGFHPYKEIVFINDTYERVLACHLDTSKIEDLGGLNLDTTNIEDLGLNRDHMLKPIHTSFVYTPCWMVEGFPKNN
ncbi:hypothetical protein EJB05_44337, partial [Eragrostis curvula]